MNVTLLKICLETIFFLFNDYCNFTCNAIIYKFNKKIKNTRYKISVKKKKKKKENIRKKVNAIEFLLIEALISDNVT